MNRLTTFAAVLAVLSGALLCAGCAEGPLKAKGKILTDESGQRWIVADERSDSYHFNAQLIKAAK